MVNGFLFEFVYNFLTSSHNLRMNGQGGMHQIIYKTDFNEKITEFHWILQLINISNKFPENPIGISQ